MVEIIYFLNEHHIAYNIKLSKNYSFVCFNAYRSALLCLLIVFHNDDSDQSLRELCWHCSNWSPPSCLNNYVTDGYNMNVATTTSHDGKSSVIALQRQGVEKDVFYNICSVRSTDAVTSLNQWCTSWWWLYTLALLQTKLNHYCCVSKDVFVVSIYTSRLVLQIAQSSVFGW